MATLLELPLAQIPPTQVPLVLLPRLQVDLLGQKAQIHTERQLGILWTRPTPVPVDPVLHPPIPI